MAMEPEPQPISHRQLAGAGRERGEGDGADLALGELAVMLEQLIGESGAEGDDLGVRARLDFDGDEVQRLHIVEAEILGARCAHALLRAAQGFEHMQAERVRSRAAVR